MLEGDSPEEMGFPPLDTEEGRDEWIELMLEEEEWDASAIIARYGDDLVMRVRFDDGTQAIFDCKIRREMDVVVETPEGEKN